MKYLFNRILGSENIIIRRKHVTFNLYLPVLQQTVLARTRDVQGLKEMGHELNGERDW